MASGSELVVGGSLDALEGSVCAIGVFDGVHSGHRFLIGIARELARDEGRRCACITFDIDPDERFVPGFRKIMGNAERIHALGEAGFDDVVVLRFSEAFADLDPNAFLEAILADRPPSAAVVAEDFRFGRAASGDAGMLRSWCEQRGIRVIAVELYEQGGEPVTSTRIRALLEAGDVEGAEALLGHPYTISSVVLEGRQAGREMGIRTANLHLPDELRVLADGVYAAHCTVDGIRYRAGVSVGIPPTFEDEATANIEAHILDFDGDLYGKRIELAFRKRIRDMVRFRDTEELVSTIQADLDFVRTQLS